VNVEAVGWFGLGPTLPAWALAVLVLLAAAVGIFATQCFLLYLVTRFDAVSEGERWPAAVAVLPAVASLVALLASTVLGGVMSWVEERAERDRIRAADRSKVTGGLAP
jgi:predicted phage tail protein